jgi:hypothetical protein
MATGRGDATEDGDLGKVWDGLSGRWGVDLHIGVDELAPGLIGILALVLLNPA